MDDLHLLHRYAVEGDRQAISSLVGKYQNVVLATCYRRLGSTADAEDAMQQVLLAMVHNAGRIDTSLSRWLHRCCLNVTASMIRSRRSRTYREREKGRQEPFSCGDGEAERKESFAILAQCLQRLSPQDRQLLLDNLVNDMTQQSIGASLGMTQQGVAKRIGRIVASLRRELTAKGVVVSLLGAMMLQLKRFVTAAVSNTSALSAPAAIPAGVGGGSVTVSKTAVAAGLVLAALTTYSVVETPRLQPPLEAPGVSAARQGGDGFIALAARDPLQDAAAHRLPPLIPRQQVLQPVGATPPVGRAGQSSPTARLSPVAGNRDAARPNRPSLSQQTAASAGASATPPASRRASRAGWDDEPKGQDALAMGGTPADESMQLRDASGDSSEQLPSTPFALRPTTEAGRASSRIRLSRESLQNWTGQHTAIAGGRYKQTISQQRPVIAAVTDGDYPRRAYELAADSKKFLLLPRNLALRTSTQASAPPQLAVRSGGPGITDIPPAADGVTRVEEGRLLTAMGTLDGRVVNQGVIRAQSEESPLCLTGLVSGRGSYSGEVLFSGGFSPGNSPAAVHLDSATLDSDNVLTMELSGLTPGLQYDQLVIGDHLVLGGVLDVELIYGFRPDFGNRFDLFRGNTSGSFETILLPTLEAGLRWDLTSLYAGGSVQVVPEPGALAVFAACGIALLRRFRRGAT
ncbi:MAG: sigma-70 family RNA polymerase sigma factor [Planctomycetaceae bacterium]|nr:sigma-70 family RNA polymerase sigma factor [Planctomycetaceae bacterium]